MENTSDLAAALPYIFPSLVARLGSEDLDGVAHLPEVMRPDPEQKPTELAQPVAPRAIPMHFIQIALHLVKE